MKLKNIFKRRPVFISDKAEAKDYLKVVVLNEPVIGMMLNTSLGITDERRKQLIDHYDAISAECNFVSDILEKMSPAFVHANELAFIAFHIGAMNQINRNPFARLFNSKK